AVQGVVIDSIRRMPLAGATVFLESVRRSTVTDQAGRFRLEGLPEGNQRIAFMHPRADSLGISVRPTPLALEPGKQSVVDLFIPRGAACPTYGDDQGTVAGVVYDATNGEPLAGATVTVEWRSRSTADRGFAGPIRTLSARTGTDGSYVICGFHLHQEISLRAKHSAGDARVEVDAARFVLQDFLVR